MVNDSSKPGNQAKATAETFEKPICLACETSTCSCRRCGATCAESCTEECNVEEERGRKERLS